MIRRRRHFVPLVIAAAVLVGCSGADRSPLALSRELEGESGRYMGGGNPLGGPRRPHEGTWARDYVGLNFFFLSDLRWSHSPDVGTEGLGSY